MRIASSISNRLNRMLRRLQKRRLTGVSEQTTQNEFFIESMSGIYFFSSSLLLSGTERNSYEFKSTPPFASFNLFRIAWRPAGASELQRTTSKSDAAHRNAVRLKAISKAIRVKDLESETIKPNANGREWSSP